jgi:integrase
VTTQRDDGEESETDDDDSDPGGPSTLAELDARISDDILLKIEYHSRLWQEFQSRLPKQQHGARHSGSISPRPKDRNGVPGWQIRVAQGADPNGKRETKTKVIRGSHADAVQARNQLQARFGSDRPGAIEVGLTVGELLNRWQGAHSGIWKPSTVRVHREIADVKLQPFHDAPIDKLGTKTIRQFYELLRDVDGLADSYIARIHGVLSSAMNWGMSEELCRTNPAANVRNLKRKPPRKTPATAEGVEAMIALATPREAAVLNFARWTGARRGEIAGLKWSDIDKIADDRYRVTFVRAISDNKVVDGLKAADEKLITLPAHVVDPCRDTRKSDIWVFGTGDKFLPPRALTTVYSSLRDQVLDNFPDMEKTTFHSMRGLCTSLLVGSGKFSWPEVSDYVGTSIAVLMRTYAHSIDDSGDKIIAALDDVFG